MLGWERVGHKQRDRLHQTLSTILKKDSKTFIKCVDACTTCPIISFEIMKKDDFICSSSYLEGMLVLMVACFRLA